MREMTIGKNDAGQRLDRFLSKSLPLLPPALAQKYIRIKRVKVNGGRAQRDQRLREGDTLNTLSLSVYQDLPTTARLLKNAGYSTVALHSHTDELYNRAKALPLKED